MTIDEITKAREAFRLKLDKWAFKHGYKRRQGIWHLDGVYLTARSEEPGKFIAERRAIGTGAHIADQEL